MFDEQSEASATDATEEAEVDREATTDTGDVVAPSPAEDNATDDDASAAVAEPEETDAEPEPVAETAAEPEAADAETAAEPEPIAESASAAQDEGQAPAAAESGDDEGDSDEPASVDPEVREYINQDTTVLRISGDGSVIPAECRTLPGASSGLDPNVPEERDVAPGASSSRTRPAGEGSDRRIAAADGGGSCVGADAGSPRGRRKRRLNGRTRPTRGIGRPGTPKKPPMVRTTRHVRILRTPPRDDPGEPACRRDRRSRR